MTFRVGQKVVCVDSDGSLGPKPHVHLKQILTIRGFITGPSLRFGPQTLGLYFNEIVRPANPRLGREYAFAAERFRPLVAKPTSIEWAHRIDRKVFGGVDA